MNVNDQHEGAHRIREDAPVWSEKTNVKGKEAGDQGQTVPLVQAKLVVRHQNSVPAPASASVGTSGIPHLSDDIMVRIAKLLVEDEDLETLKALTRSCRSVCQLISPFLFMDPIIEEDVYSFAPRGLVMTFALALLRRSAIADVVNSVQRLKMTVADDPHRVLLTEEDKILLTGFVDRLPFASAFPKQRAQWKLDLRNGRELAAAGVILAMLPKLTHLDLCKVRKEAGYPEVPNISPVECGEMFGGLEYPYLIKGLASLQSTRSAACLPRWSYVLNNLTRVRCRFGSPTGVTFAYESMNKHAYTCGLHFPNPLQNIKDLVIDIDIKYIDADRPPPDVDNDVDAEAFQAAWTHLRAFFSWTTAVDSLRFNLPDFSHPDDGYVASPAFGMLVQHVKTWSPKSLIVHIPGPTENFGIDTRVFTEFSPAVPVRDGFAGLTRLTYLKVPLQMVCWDQSTFGWISPFLGRVEYLHVTCAYADGIDCLGESITNFPEEFPCLQKVTIEYDGPEDADLLDGAHDEWEIPIRKGMDVEVIFYCQGGSDQRPPCKLPYRLGCFGATTPLSDRSASD